MFKEKKCSGSMTLYYPHDCDMCSFGGINVRDQACQEEWDHDQEMEERAMYGDDYEFIC